MGKAVGVLSDPLCNREDALDAHARQDIDGASEHAHRIDVIAGGDARTPEARLRGMGAAEEELEACVFLAVSAEGAAGILRPHCGIGLLHLAPPRYRTVLSPSHSPSLPINAFWLLRVLLSGHARHHSTTPSSPGAADPTSAC